MTPPQPNRSESKRLLSRPKEEKLRKKKHKKNATAIHVGDYQELDSRKVTDAVPSLPLPPPRQQQDQDQEGAGKGGTYCWRKTASSIPILSSLSTTTSTPSSPNKCKTLLDKSNIGSLPFMYPFDSVLQTSVRLFILSFIYRV